MAAAAKKTLSTSGPMENSYLSGLQDLLTNSISTEDCKDHIVDLMKLLRQPEDKRTRIFYTNEEMQSHIGTPSDIVALSANDESIGRKAVCVVENISPRCIEVLGSAWALDREFFLGHAKNPIPERLWADQSPEYGVRKYRHLSGVFEYPVEKGQVGLNSLPNYFPRHCFEEPTYSIQSNTRISYYRVHQDLYLFLVDAPLDIMTTFLELYPRTRPTLRLKYAMNRGGLLLPQLFSQAKYSLLDSLEAFFRHAWHFKVLFNGDDCTIPSQPLLYMLSSSLWESNLRFLTKHIRQISFEELRNPSLNTNNALHTRREDLAFMKSSLTETLKYVPAAVVTYLDNHIYFVSTAPLRWTYDNPLATLQRSLDQAVQLDRFLMETFQLLMSSISVRESQLSIEQSKRATRLTQLAFIYIPLSFVTGIFGMNVHEINGTGLSIWVCFVTLAIIVALTMVIFWLLHARTKKIEEEKNIEV